MIKRKLKEIRVRNGLSQQQAADVLGICRSAYCNYELGRRSPDFATIKKLADFYNISLDAFTDRDDLDFHDESEYEGGAPKYLSELSKEERDLIVKFRLLDKKEQKLLFKNLTEQSD
mgnify:CR=1 FL=1